MTNVDFVTDTAIQTPISMMAGYLLAKVELYFWAQWRNRHGR